MAPKRAKQLEKLAELLGGGAPPESAKKTKPNKSPKQDQTDHGDETPSTTTPGETETPVETPVETPSEVDKEKPLKKRIRGKGGDRTEESEPPPKAPKAAASKPKAAKAKAKAKEEKPPMPEPTWDNFELVREHFGLTEEECTEVLLRVCGPNPKGDKYWENFRVKPGETSETAEEDPQGDGMEDGGDGTPRYVNGFDGDEMSEDDPELEPKGPAPVIEKPDAMEVVEAISLLQVVMKEPWAQKLLQQNLSIPPVDTSDGELKDALDGKPSSSVPQRVAPTTPLPPAPEVPVAKPVAPVEPVIPSAPAVVAPAADAALNVVNSSTHRAAHARLVRKMQKKIENIIKREGIMDPDAPDDAASTRWWCSVGGKATSTERVSLNMTASASVATTPENLGSMLGEPGSGGGAPLALTNGADTGGAGRPSLEALVDIMKAGNGGGVTPAPKAKGKAKAKAKAMVTRDTSKPTEEQLADIRKEIKKEFNGCTVSMELPQGHALRSQLDNMKSKFEKLLDELAYGIGSGHYGVRHSRHVAEAYDSDLITSGRERGLHERAISSGASLPCKITEKVYWSGNELVGPDGIEDEARWPFRPSKLDVGSVYEGMKDRLNQLNVVAKKCSTFASVAGPESSIYGFIQVWDMFFERFRTWCKDLNLKYVDATFVAEHIDKADHYHGRKTFANVSKITSFFIALLQAQQIGKRFERFAPAFDAILARRLILSYDDFIEMEDNTAQSQKQRLAYQKVKQRAVQEHMKQKLGRSKTFTPEQIDDLAPMDEEMTEADKTAIVEVGAHVSMMEVDAPRKRQAEAHAETTPTKHRAMKPELSEASSSLGSSAKHAPAEPKISTAVKSTQPLPPSTSEPSSGSGLKRPPPPPKGVSVARPPERTQAADVKLEYFDMATDYQGFAHLDDVKRELLTGKFSRIVAQLTEYGNNGMPPRMYHRTSATAALEILRHGLIPGGVGITESGKKHCYLSPCQLSETGYKSGVRADQPYEVAFDTELALRSAVDLTMTSSEALITTQHIPNSCILWVKNTRDGTFIFSLTEEDKRKTYRQAEYAGVLASDTFGPAVATGSSPRDEIPAETHGREEASDVKTVVTQIKRIEERVRGDDEANEPVSVEERRSAIEQPTQMFGTASAASKGTIPSGTYVALPESACPNCIGPMIDGMFTCMNCQRTLGTGPMERINKNERAHVAKICFITVPYLLHDEFKDRHGSEWMVFWHQKLFTLTDFVVAVCQAHFDDVMVLTFSQENQGLIEFHLKGLDEQERYNHLKTRFDEDLDIAARQHYMAENNSRRSRKQDATLERIETEREDVNFPIPAEASIDYRGYQPRPTQFRLVPKQPPGPPPGRLLPPPEPDVPPAAAPAYPPDVRDRPARAEAAPVSSRPTFQLRTNGYWYWSRNLADWVWYQTGNRNEHNPYSPDFIPSDDTLNDWMGRGAFLTVIPAALLAHGAEPEERTEEARTPLICAAARGHALVVMKLLHFQADVQALDKMNQTALHAASVGGKAECIQLLHKKRARLEQKDGSGRTPMQLALDCQQEGSIRMLLKLRAVLPEEAAKKPEMQPLIQEVEREVLLEQLKEAELLCSKEQLKDAEQAFEDARQHLLRLIQLSETARVTPVIQNAEFRLSDLEEQCRVCKQEANRTEAKIKETEAELAKLLSDHKEQSKDLALLRRDLDSLRAAKSKRMEELQQIKQLIQQVLKVIQDAKSKDSGVDAETQKALKRIEELKKQLEKLKTNGVDLQRELDELNSKCQKFDQEKAEVAALHARARELLSKPGRVA
eukprot:symbB.v1.2.014565.t2/scaffold1068.1/size140200/6